MEQYNTLPGAPGLIYGIKKICKECSHWTQNPAHDSYRCRTMTCPDVQREEMNMQHGDEGQWEWEKENRPEMWVKTAWGIIQTKMAEVAEVLEAHPELEGVLSIPREEKDEDD